MSYWGGGGYDPQALRRFSRSGSLPTNAKGETPEDQRGREDWGFTPCSSYSLVCQKNVGGFPRVHPLNTSRVQILKEVYSTPLIQTPLYCPAQMGPHKDKWCAFHRTRGHETDECYVMMRQIEKLTVFQKDGYPSSKGMDIWESMSRRPSTHCFANKEDYTAPAHQSDFQQQQSREREKHERPVLGDFNTISGGFAGGGMSASARKRYCRPVMYIVMGSSVAIDHPPIIFTAEDFGVFCLIKMTQR